jgi:hypothetical protein
MAAEPVECYSGTTYAQRPVALTWEGARLPITEVEAGWRTADGRAFRVRTEDGRAFNLAYDESNDTWLIRLA